jgi:Ni/Co efflux regulator RcnB
MSKFLSAVLAAIFALVTVTPVAFADKHEMKKAEKMEKKGDKKADEKKAEKMEKKGDKKAEEKKDGKKKSDEKKK